jgi:hypothetical protein
MDQVQTSLGRPASLKRHPGIQRAPTLASLLCEMRVQRPDLLDVSWEVGTLTDALFADVDGRDRVAGEYGDKMLAVRVGKTIEVYSPFLGRMIPATRREVSLASRTTTEPHKTVREAPRKAPRKMARKRVQKVVST